ncbi:hypothetical protein TREES_T100010102 [Tupaia chinensis]|uniref:Uncharacterized protein n=1 Tax=Tupaia chinensis TaxID=246437 RepID=L9JBR3_TUPCH|nr:hypothetical protein TREES_T100010102 [Tupaia chinensis]
MALAHPSADSAASLPRIGDMITWPPELLWAQLPERTVRLGQGARSESNEPSYHLFSPYCFDEKTEAQKEPEAVGCGIRGPDVNDLSSPDGKSDLPCPHSVMRVLS